MNQVRRNLNKGQQAMALAMIYPDGERGRGKNAAARKASVSNGFSAQRLKDARSVLHHSRSLAESVSKGITPLDAALAKVRDEQQYQQSDEAKQGLRAFSQRKKEALYRSCPPTGFA